MRHLLNTILVSKVECDNPCFFIFDMFFSAKLLKVIKTNLFQFGHDELLLVLKSFGLFPLVELVDL